MRLCFLAGADSIHSKKWIEYFAIKGHEVHWISLTPNRFDEASNVELHLMRKVPCKSLNAILSLTSVRNLVAAIRPDILHAHYAGTNGAIAALCNFHPFILTAWGSDILIAGKSRIKGPLIKFVLNRSELITCDAEHMKKTMMELGVSSSKIRLIYFGVDTQKFCPGPKDEELQRELGTVGYKVVVSSRNLEPVYDVETLVKAAPIVLQKVPNVKFLILGKGPQGEALRELGRALGILENVIFTGSVPNDRIPLYLRVADVYVSTSLSDAGIAASTAEAMACGLPVVITHTGENGKWVTDGKNGYLVPPKSFAEVNRAIIDERNDYYKEMEKMENIYQESIQRKA
jgi:glycosyltransferase involved in cell wall biosynthesis